MGWAIREFGSGPGCAFWLVKEPMGGGENPLPSSIQTTLCAGSGPGCQLEVRTCHVKSGAPSHAEAGGNLSWFPVLEPGGAWLEPLWPNRGAEFGPPRRFPVLDPSFAWGL